MSCYVVSQKDITLLVEALYRYEVPMPSHTPDALGYLLWDANYRSVNARYRETTPTPPYVHAHCPSSLVHNTLLVYKQVRHYYYQSCDDDGWDASEACRLMAALERAACQRLGVSPDKSSKLPGWNALPWGLD